MFLAIQKSAVALLAVTAAASLDAQSVRRAKAAIDVGPSVHVSKKGPQVGHYENLAAGDPDHPGRLITCAMVYPKDDFRSFMFQQHCYVTFDGGKTWDQTLKIYERWSTGDPTEAYGLGDDVYVSYLNVGETDELADPNAPPKRDASTIIVKSRDGGRTWTDTARFEFIDRQFLAVDRTNGPYRGRVYLVGQGSHKTINGGGSRSALKMWRSLDGGKTWLGPTGAAYPEGSIIAGVGTGEVLSDGTLVAMFGLVKPGRSQSLELEPKGPNAEIHVITSRDGGETWDNSHKVTDWYADRNRSEGAFLGQLAIDRGSKYFKDRIYVVYPEVVHGRDQVRISYSADKGKTWSTPVTVNDDRNPAEKDKGPDHLLPVVGVNKDGAVMVVWYDRREFKDNLSWRPRAAVSLDGGDTFGASVPVSEHVNAFNPSTTWDVVGYGSGSSMSASLTGFFNSGGHTSGMAVDADGSFHPTWVSNHTGSSQLWSAAIRATGPVVKNGSTDLAELDDISKSVAIDMTNVSFDRGSGTLTMYAQVRSISKTTIQGPVKVRVLTMESQMGVAEITNADNGERGTGAVFDFSGLMPGDTLGTKQLSQKKKLVFKLTDLRPFRQGKDWEGGLVSLGVKTLGKLKGEKK
jgi:hypothetical protein